MDKRKLCKRGILVALFLCLCAVWLPGLKADAASGMKKLKIGKTYSCRLDGKKANKIQCTYTEKAGGGVGLNIYIDGKKQITLNDWAYSWDVAICRISAKRNLLYVRDHSDNDWCAGLRLYEYKKGKLKLLKNLTNISRDDSPLSNWARGDLIRVKGKTLTVRWSETTKSTGMIRVLITYQVSGNKIKKIGKSYEIGPISGKNSWTAKQSIVTYKKPGGTGSAFTVYAGEKVKLLRVQVKKKQRYLQVKNAAGQKGWYQDPSYYPAGGWYEEASFAG